MKLIDLNHKALIFVDTPRHTLLESYNVIAKS
jgi:hypothetical protein